MQCNGMQGLYAQLTGDVTGTKTGLETRRRKNQTKPYFHNKRLFGVDAGRCADEPWQFFCACTVVFLPKWGSRQS